MAGEAQDGPPADMASSHARLEDMPLLSDGSLVLGSGHAICCDGVCTLGGSLTGAAGGPQAAASGALGSCVGTLMPRPLLRALLRAPLRPLLVDGSSSGLLFAGVGVADVGARSTLLLNASRGGTPSCDVDSQSQQRPMEEAGTSGSCCGLSCCCSLAAWNGDTGGDTRGTDTCCSAARLPRVCCERGRHTTTATLSKAPAAAAAAAMAAACRTVRPLSVDMLQLPEAALTAAGHLQLPADPRATPAWCP